MKTIKITYLGKTEKDERSRNTAFLPVSCPACDIPGIAAAIFMGRPDR